ncbi:hypothetical protein [Terribacillus saccharophilus]|uniref:HeH/LEM domain-containing protein n=1 Tax=Terribacillus saccharophilus TaxID=361277 RepID=A0ABX4H0U0_9BACI|nr:hypothetical protein [Terribacillus saccharophilus]PAD36328.1 hypothetical protein CHH56_04875 [Terribacillus saccharophilus]PAD95030.1 hypothetical protein CHH50_15610 [Terribacillus saccharophilus]PAE00747.1 hypothetical protein CHH48_05580 [Terribacillus saccharophilus]
MNRVRVSNGKETMVVQKAMIPAGFQVVEEYKEPETVDLAEQTNSQLKKLKKDELTKYLNDNNVEYNKDATKDDLIAAIKSEPEQYAAE